MCLRCVQKWRESKKWDACSEATKSHFAKEVTTETIHVTTTFDRKYIEEYTDTHTHTLENLKKQKRKCDKVQQQQTADEKEENAF